MEDSKYAPIKAHSTHDDSDPSDPVVVSSLSAVPDPSSSSSASAASSSSAAPSTAGRAKDEDDVRTACDGGVVHQSAAGDAVLLMRRDSHEITGPGQLTRADIDLQLADHEDWYDNPLLPAAPTGYAVPVKKVCFAVTLLLIGMVALIMGGYTWVRGESPALPLFIVGGVAFIPGVYYTVLIIQVLRGVRGYTWANIFPQISD